MDYFKNLDLKFLRYDKNNSIDKIRGAQLLFFYPFCEPWLQTKGKNNIIKFNKQTKTTDKIILRVVRETIKKICNQHESEIMFIYFPL